MASYMLCQSNNDLHISVDVFSPCMNSACDPFSGQAKFEPPNFSPYSHRDCLNKEIFFAHFQPMISGKGNIYSTFLLAHSFRWQNVDPVGRILIHNKECMFDPSLNYISVMLR